MVYSGALTETYSWKKPEVENFVSDSLLISKKKPDTRKKVHRFAFTILPNLIQCTVSLDRRIGTDRSGAHRLRDVSSKGRIVQGTQKPRDALCKGLGDEITLHPKCLAVVINYWKSIFYIHLEQETFKETRLALWRNSIWRDDYF